MSENCLNKALRILARRDHSLEELRRKLIERGYGREETQSSLNECLRLGYLDDERFAHAYLRQLQRKGYGINGIRHKLYSRGIAREIVESCTIRHCTDAVELEVCRKALAKKTKHPGKYQSVRDLRPKLQRFLIGRGFSPSIVYQVLKDAIDQEKD